MIELRPTVEADVPALSALFSQRFGRPFPVEEWRWKYRQLPGEGRSWVAIAGDTLLAHAGALALPARYRGGRGCAWQLVDFVAAERIGSLRPPLVDLGRALLADLPRPTDAPFLFGFPSERHFRLGARVFGYRPLLEIEPLVGDLPAGDGGALPAGIAASDVAPAGALEIWRRAQVLGVERSEAFLNWRYHARPERYYRFYSIETGGVPDDGGGRGFVTFAFVGREAWAAELWLPPGPDWRPVLAALGADLARAGLARWTFWPPAGGRADLLAVLASLGLAPSGERRFVGCRGRIGGPDPVEAAAGFVVSMGDYDLV